MFKRKKRIQKTKTARVPAGKKARLPNKEERTTVRVLTFDEARDIGRASEAFRSLALATYNPEDYSAEWLADKFNCIEVQYNRILRVFDTEGQGDPAGSANPRD